VDLLDQIKKRYIEKNGVFCQVIPESDFEDQYIELRKREGRLYPVSIIKSLPEVSPDHKHYKEWLVRKRSSGMLIEYISSDHSDKQIAEIGCGNGWLTGKLSKISNSKIIGIDINLHELEQAAKLFGNLNTAFIYGDVFKLDLQFDYIILAGVAAYFKDLRILISSLQKSLNPEGSIHIIDSPFYDNPAEARKRSENYFKKLGLSQFINYYFHHDINALKDFRYSILYDPSSAANKLKRFFFSSQPPFHWIQIKK
jgi:ubiquinone/menaquinone biosynthesis C-methylase UbiE